MTAPLASLVRRLAAEGCTGEQIAAAVEFQEQEGLARAARRSEANAARQARWRQNRSGVGVTRRNKTLRDVTPQQQDDWPPDFREQFWLQYPNKVGKADALRSLDRARKSGVGWLELMVGLARYVSKTDDRPWCNPATWLNQQRWTDEPANGGRNGHRASPVGSAFDDLIARSEGLGSPSGDEPADDGPHAGPQGR